jgi:hypothetical protein
MEKWGGYLMEIYRVAHLMETCSLDGNLSLWWDSQLWQLLTHPHYNDIIQGGPLDGNPISA